MQKLVDTIFSFTVTKKARLIDVFKLIYCLIVLFYIWAGVTIFENPKAALMFYDWGLAAGRTALSLFIIILIPGIAERFGIRHKLIAILRIFRRYLGISMYLFVFMHLSFLWLILAIKTSVFFPILLFQMFGLIAAILLFFLFITSNDISVKNLNIGWYRIHRAIYIAMFFIFLHTALQRWSIWSVLMGITLIFMIASFIYSFLKFGKKPYEK